MSKRGAYCARHMHDHPRLLLLGEGTTIGLKVTTAAVTSPPAGSSYHKTGANG
jgi:hypothetical protein